MSLRYFLTDCSKISLIEIQKFVNIIIMPTIVQNLIQKHKHLFDVRHPRKQFAYALSPSISYNMWLLAHVASPSAGQVHPQRWGPRCSCSAGLEQRAAVSKRHDADTGHCSLSGCRSGRRLWTVFPYLFYVPPPFPDIPPVSRPPAIRPPLRPAFPR